MRSRSQVGSVQDQVEAHIPVQSPRHDTIDQVGSTDSLVRSQDSDISTDLENQCLPVAKERKIAVKFRTTKNTCLQQARTCSWLPYDILRIIFDLLRVRDLTRCSQVCKQWHSILDDDKLWEKKIRDECQRTRYRPALPNLPAQMTYRDILVFFRTGECSLCIPHSYRPGSVATSFCTSLCRSYIRGQEITDWDARAVLERHGVPTNVLENLRRISWTEYYSRKDVESICQNVSAYSSEKQILVESARLKLQKSQEGEQRLYLKEWFMLLNHYFQWSEVPNGGWRWRQIFRIAKETGLTAQQIGTFKALKKIPSLRKIVNDVSQRAFCAHKDDHSVRDEIKQILLAKVTSDEVRKNKKTLLARAKQQAPIMLAAVIETTPMYRERAWFFFRGGLLISLDLGLLREDQSSVLKHAPQQLIWALEVDWVILLRKLSRLYRQTEFASVISLNEVLIRCSSWPMTAAQRCPFLWSEYSSRASFTCTRCQVPQVMGLRKLFSSGHLKHDNCADYLERDIDLPDNPMWRELHERVVALKPCKTSLEKWRPNGRELATSYKAYEFPSTQGCKGLAFSAEDVSQYQNFIRKFTDELIDPITDWSG